MPESVRLVVRRRLERLGEGAGRVLSAAAVLGRTFTFELLQVLEQMPEDPLLDLVEEAERTGLILSVAESGPEDRFLFAHELISKTLLAELSSPRRRRLHVRAAEAVEQVHAANLEEHAAEIANHLLEAGGSADVKRAFSYLTMAGERAMASSAFEEALRHLERATDLAGAATPQSASRSARTDRHGSA